MTTPYHSVKESIIFVLTMLGIAFLARILTSPLNPIISSIIVVTSIAIFFYLASQNKLGIISLGYHHKLAKLRRSKLKYAILALYIFVAINLGIMVLGLAYPTESLSLVETELATVGVTDYSSLRQFHEENPLTIPQGALAVQTTALAPFIDWDLYAAVLQTADKLSDGWLGHLIIVSFAETLIIIYLTRPIPVPRP